MSTDRAPLLLAALVAAALTTACAADTSPQTASDDAAAPDAEAGADTESGQDDPSDEPGQSEQRFPDVIAAELEAAGDAWRLDATLSSPYDTPERYADAFRAVSEDGEVLGVRELAHDHANEQPFTRSLTGLEIPDDVERITVEGRDLAHGWGGDTVELEVPSRSEAGG